MTEKEIYDLWCVQQKIEEPFKSEYEEKLKDTMGFQLFAVGYAFNRLAKDMAEAAVFVKEVFKEAFR